jgi:hypothetical protein
MAAKLVSFYDICRMHIHSKRAVSEQMILWQGMASTVPKE